MENTINNIAKGVGIALLASLILLLIFAIMLTYTNVSENVVTPVIIVITAISILIGSSVRKHENQKKWTNKWRFNRRFIHFYHLFDFQFLKLEIWVKYAKNNYDCGWNNIWNFRWNYWSKQKINQASLFQ